jgi:hypothetical protein
MPHLSAASRLSFPDRPAHFHRPRWSSSACADPRPPGDDALKAAESQDTLSLTAPETKAETTTINVGTLRVAVPGANDTTKNAETKLDPPACIFEC